jgi:1-deoxy-D-xylulose-5-phosphate synthase
VIFAIDRAGLVGADGPTHHGVFDLAYLGMIPGMRILAPETLSDAETCLREALKEKGPVAIRYPRGSAPVEADSPLKDGLRWHRKASNPALNVISAGAASKRVAKAIEKLEPALSERISWISAVQLKPVPEAVLAVRKSGGLILSVEDGVIHGGFGQQIGAERTIGYPDHFIQHGAVDQLEALEHVAASDIEREIRALLKSDS